MPVKMFRPYLELMKPRLTSLVIFTTWLGYTLGNTVGSDPLGGQTPSTIRFVHTLIGSWWVAAGAAALNQWMERDLDALMHRTRTRPLPEKRIAPGAALRFGLAISVLGAVELAVFVNALTAALSLFSLGSYLLWYTPLKTRTALCTLVGAIPGAVPPMMGWTAATGSLDLPAWILFGILFLWQLPHFLAIAWMYREDYARAGFPMLPVIDPDGHSTARMILVYSLFLIPMSLLPVRVGLAGASYGMGAILLGVGFLFLGAAAAWQRTAEHARRLLLGSVVYLPTLLGWMALGR